MSDDHLRDLMHRISPNGAAEKVEDEGVPETEFGDGYQAAGIVGQGKALLRLHIIREPGPRVTMQYVHINSHSVYEPGRFVVEFAGTKHWRVTVTGRNLWKIYDAITRHALAWIQQAMPGRDFEERKGQAVITRIEVEEVKEEE